MTSIISSNTIFYKGIKFDSHGELVCYKLLLQKYSKKDIQVHKKFTLCNYPRKLSLNLDFEVPDFYVEYKGSWAFTHSAIKQGQKVKFFWFMNQYRDKPLIICTDQLDNAKKKHVIKGISITNLQRMQQDIKNHDCIYTQR